MTICSGMIACGRFHDFVKSVGRWTVQEQEEKEEETLLQIWLHKVFDKSYSEFKQSLGMSKNAAPSKEEQAEIVRQSHAMLDGFRPSEADGHGTIPAAGTNRNRQ